MEKDRAHGSEFRVVLGFVKKYSSRYLPYDSDTLNAILGFLNIVCQKDIQLTVSRMFLSPGRVPVPLPCHGIMTSYFVIGKGF